MRRNDFGQPIGEALPDWSGAGPPPRTAMRGRLCVVEPLAEAHADDLFDAFSEDADGRLWTYSFSGPFPERDGFAEWVASIIGLDDPLFHAVVDNATGKALGVAAYLRVRPEAGSIEVGSIAYAPRLQRTAMATEAMYLMMHRVFDELGYRRYEWKCDALNAPSCRAAERLGFTYDGLFRQAMIYKGRNRDTAWYSLLDGDWPAVRAAMRHWLAADNFDAKGRQKERLSALIARERDAD